MSLRGCKSNIVNIFTLLNIYIHQCVPYPSIAASRHELPILQDTNCVDAGVVRVIHYPHHTAALSSQPTQPAITPPWNNIHQASAAGEPRVCSV